MVNGRPCEYCKDNVRKQFQQCQQQHLDKVFLISDYLTAHVQKTLSKKLEINEKDIRLWFRKERAKGKKEYETEENADISTTFICMNDRVPHYPHLLRGPNDVCHFSDSPQPNIVSK